MARFLFTAWPFAGHYFPLVALAKELAASGHEVAFYSGPSACKVVGAEGLRCFPFQEVNEQRVQAIIASQNRGSLAWNRLWHFRRTLREWLVGMLPQQVADLHRVVDQWEPDVVVSEPTLFGALLVLPETRDVPVAIGSFIPACSIPGPDAPPFGMGLPSPTTLPTRLLSWVAQHLTHLFGREIRQMVDRVRMQQGLDPLPMTIYEYMGTLPLYLVPTLPELDYNRTDLPPTVQYVGPYHWNPPHDAPAARWLEELPTDRPWVHVSEGTLHNSDPFLLRASMAGLAGLPVEVIMSSGGRSPESLGVGTLPSNVQLVPWVSHQKLLPRTDVLITTGGAGTVLAALREGVPIVIVPTEWDKPEIAQRMVAAGVAIKIPVRRCTPERVREATQRLLDEPIYRERAQHVARRFAASGGAARASELLVELAETTDLTAGIASTESPLMKESDGHHATA